MLIAVTARPPVALFTQRNDDEHHTFTSRLKEQIYARMVQAFSYAKT